MRVDASKEDVVETVDAVDVGRQCLAKEPDEPFADAVEQATPVLRDQRLENGDDGREVRAVEEQKVVEVLGTIARVGQDAVDQGVRDVLLVLLVRLTDL